VEIVFSLAEVGLDQGRGQVRGIVGKQQRTRFVVKLQQHVQIPSFCSRRRNPGLHAQADGSRAGYEGEDVQIGAPLEHALVGGIGVGGVVFGRGRDNVGAAAEDQRGGRAGAVCVIIRTIRDFSRDGRQVILGVVGEIVFALGPLADIPSVTRAH